MNRKEYVTHPIDVNYEASRDEVVRHRERKILLGSVNNTGYIRITIIGKPRPAHRLIYQCFNGVICNGLVIDHINQNHLDNRMKNN